MAFQHQNALGHNAAGPGVGEQHGPQGTEYTLQGVMRFLQIEWHNHERARNTWDIERAEMKTRIAKLEGESRHAKRINEQLDRQVRMLEMALKNERARNKAGGSANGGAAGAENGAGASPSASSGPAELKSGASAPQESESRGKVKNDGKSGLPQGHNSFLQTTDSSESLVDKEHAQTLDSSSKYLDRCMKEIQWLLTPQNVPPPTHLLPNGNYTGLPEAPLPLEDVYARHQRSQRQPPMTSPHPQSMMSQQQASIPNSLPQVAMQHDNGNRGVHYQDYAHMNQPSANTPGSAHPSTPYNEHVETITHTFDARGRPVPEQVLQQPQQVRSQGEVADGWNFDEEPSAQPEIPPPDVPPPRRPDTDLFPSAANPSHLPSRSPTGAGLGSHRRKSSGSQAMSRRRSSQGRNDAHDSSELAPNSDPSQFKVKFALRGHLDVVRSVIFSGGGSPSEPEICTASDDGTIKRWYIPATYQHFSTPGNANADLDITAFFTHRGHEGVVTSLATCPPSTGFSTGGRAHGDGWIFSGGQDATVRVWERGRVDPKATLEGHTDAVWAVCVLPATVGAVFGNQSSSLGGPDRLILVSGSADGTVKVWAVTPPPQTSSPATGSRRGVGGSRRHSVTSGSNFPSSPQPSVASSTPFGHTLIHSIERQQPALHSALPAVSPTSICPLSPSGETFVVSYTDSSVLIFDTRSGEEVIGMASNETYDGTLNTSINAVVATSLGLESSTGSSSILDASNDDVVSAGATGGREGVEGVVISGHEDRFVRFFDANSGQCTYTMLAHTSAISALALSKDGREAVSVGHDASIRFWSLEKRICTQDIVSHRAMRGEGICDVAWSQDGRLVVSAGGDGVVKVFAR